MNRGFIEVLPWVPAHPARTQFWSLGVEANSARLEMTAPHEVVGKSFLDPPFPFLRLVAADRPRWSTLPFHQRLLSHEVGVVVWVEVLLPILRHYPEVSGGPAVFQQAVVVRSIQDLPIYPPVPPTGNPLVVFLAGRAGVAGDRRGFSRSSHNGRVYTDCLTFRIQRTGTGTAAAAGPGPLERGVRQIRARVFQRFLLRPDQANILRGPHNRQRVAPTY